MKAFFAIIGICALIGLIAFVVWFIYMILFVSTENIYEAFHRRDL